MQILITAYTDKFSLNRHPCKLDRLDFVEYHKSKLYIMTDSDEDISISQNSKNHTGVRKLRLRNQVRIKLFYIILQLTLHSDDKLCVYCM